jgi:hypothetical protein
MDRESSLAKVALFASTPKCVSHRFGLGHLVYSFPWVLSYLYSLVGVLWAIWIRHLSRSLTGFATKLDLFFTDEPKGLLKKRGFLWIAENDLHESEDL